MKLRIIVGKSTVQGIPHDGDLASIHQAKNMIVQGTPDVLAVRLDDGRQLLIAGEVVGLRTCSNGMSEFGFTLAGWHCQFARKSLAELQDVLEGRYIIVMIGTDGVCEIGADRFGQMDMYYQRIETTTIFASDLSLLPVSKGAPEYDQLALVHTLCAYGWRPPKRHTPYREVRRLGIRERATIKSGKVDFVEIPFQPLTMGRYGERELHEYADILLDAVRVRGSRYGNVVYLSSGWDSTAILACLVKLFGARKVRAVTGRMQYADRSGVINQFEIDRAKAVAEYYGVHLDIAEFDYRKSGPDQLERLKPLLQAHHVISLTAMSHGILADFVAQTTGGDEAVFAGEISDGAHNLGFSQFATIFHPSQEFREYSDKMASYLYGPTFLKLFKGDQFSSDPVYGLLRNRCGDAVFDEPAKKDEGPGRSQQLLASFFLRSNRIPLYSLRNSRLLTDAGRKAYSAEMETSYLKQAAENLTPETLYSWYLHLYNSFHWQGSTVTTIPLTGRDQGLLMQLPFWDSRLQEFLSAMPESWGRGLDLNPTKYPLKWTLRHKIDYPLHLQAGPHSYLYDVDPSFSHAAEVLYASSFNIYFKNRLRKGSIRQTFRGEIFDLRYIDGVINRFLADTEARGSELNDLVALCWISSIGLYGTE